MGPFRVVTFPSGRQNTVRTDVWFLSSIGNGSSFQSDRSGRILVSSIIPKNYSDVSELGNKWEHG